MSEHKAMLEIEFMRSTMGARRSLGLAEKHWAKGAQTEREHAEARDAVFAVWRLNLGLKAARQALEEAAERRGGDRDQ